MSEILFQSLINVDLWNKARWTATAFLCDPRSTDPSCLGLVFENTEAGRKIFGELRNRIGIVDEFEELYVSIVEGTILGEDPGYTVHISSDPFRTESRLRAQGKDFAFEQPQFDCAIEKGEIHFRQASDITRTDRDAVVFPVNYFDNESIN